MISDEPMSTRFRPKALTFKRRAAERLRCKSRLIGQLMVLESGEKVDAWVLDLSEKGIGFIVSKKIAENTAVTFNVKKNVAVSVGIKIPLRVVHARAESDCCWHIGCEFNDPLTAEMLDYLVG